MSVCRNALTPKIFPRSEINENVDVFVTGDKDFLVLNIKVPEIMTMTGFLEKYA